MAGHGAPEDVVVVGGGQAGFQTAVSLREGGFTGRVTLVAGEGPLPYQRPPLSKAFLTGDGGFEDVVLRAAPFYPAQDIDVLPERAAALDREVQRVVLASGRRLPYDRLVLALGARPRTLPVPGAGLDGVLALRSFADAAELRHRLSAAKRAVVVGAGFIGLEVAAAARGLGLEVTVVEAGRRAMARAVSEPVSAALAAAHEQRGVRVLFGAEVSAVRGDGAGRATAVQLADGRRLPADLVVVGTGVLPDTALAADAGLAVGDGVLVDERLRTGDPLVYAIGDCARFPSPHTGGHLRLESVQNAVDQARCVADAICGRPRAYTAVPWFWTEQYGLRLQMAGITAGHDRAVVAGDPDGGRFSVFCFTGGTLAGVESVNRPADHLTARRLLAGGGPAPSPEEVAAPGFDLREALRRQPV